MALCPQRDAAREFPPPDQPSLPLSICLFALQDLDESDQFLVVASDGLWDVMSPQEVCDVVMAQKEEGLDSQAIANGLVRAALHRGSQDNIIMVGV